MNKKTINLIAICICVLIIVFSYIKNDFTNKETESENINIKNSTTTDNTSSENTYKETILKSLSENRINALENFSNAFKSTSSDSVSDNLTKEVFKKYVDYNSTGELDAKEIEKLATNALQDVKINLNLYTINDIKIGDDSKELLKEYLNSIAFIMIENGLNIKKQGSAGKIEKYLKTSYQTVALKLLDIKVPDTLAKEHLNLINAYIKFDEVIRLLNKQNVDPVVALSGVKLGQETSTAAQISFENIKETAIINNIQFTEKEPGIIFYK